MMPPLERRRHLSILSSAFLMMTALVFGKLFGQLREILLAPQIGVGAISDGYLLGFQIPDLLYELLIGGAIQAAITPTLAGAIENRTLRAGWRSVSIFLNLAATVMLAFIVIGQFLAPVLIPALYSDKSAETITVAIRVARTLFPQVFFMMLAALCIGILNAYRRFERTAFGPVLYNAGVVLSMLLLGDRTANGAVKVAAGVMLSATFFFLLQFYLARDVFSKYYRFSFDIRDPGFKRLLRLAIPTMLAASIGQINVIVLNAFIFRSFPQEGLVTALRYASTTWQLPYGILAVAIGNVLLPTLAAHARAGQNQSFRRLFGHGLRNALFLVIPIAGLFLAMREDVVRAIFQWGRSLPDTMVVTTASILVFYCASIVIQTLIFLFSIACFSAGNTRIPLLGGAASLVSNFVFCLVFTRIPGAPPAVMSLSFMLSGVCSAAIITLLFRRRYPHLRPAGAGRRFSIQMAICLGATLVVVYALGTLPVPTAGKLWQLVWLGLRCVAGILAFYLAARSLRVPEADAWEKRVAGIVGRLIRRPVKDENKEDEVPPEE